MSLKGINLLQITGTEAAKLGLSWGRGSSLFVVVQSLIRPTLCNPMGCSMTGFPVLHYIPEFA